MGYNISNISSFLYISQTYQTQYDAKTSTENHIIKRRNNTKMIICYISYYNIIKYFYCTIMNNNTAAYKHAKYCTYFKMNYYHFTIIYHFLTSILQNGFIYNTFTWLSIKSIIYYYIITLHFNFCLVRCILCYISRSSLINICWLIVSGSFSLVNLLFNKS